MYYQWHICVMMQLVMKHDKWKTVAVCLWTHDGKIPWKCFLYYWPFVRGIHWSAVDSLHKGLICKALMCSLLLALRSCWTNRQSASDLRCHVELIWHDEDIWFLTRSVRRFEEEYWMGQVIWRCICLMNIFHFLVTILIEVFCFHQGSNFISLSHHCCGS